MRKKFNLRCAICAQEKYKFDITEKKSRRIGNVGVEKKISGAGGGRKERVSKTIFWIGMGGGGWELDDPNHDEKKKSRRL